MSHTFTNRRATESIDQVATAINRLRLAREELNQHAGGAEHSYSARLCRRAVFLSEQLATPGSASRTDPVAVSDAIRLAAEIDHYVAGLPAGDEASSSAREAGRTRPEREAKPGAGG